jgi:DNA-binding NarL/FixJ family response regulator
LPQSGSAGTILRISAATVGKHFEHIYPKLGVENRTAAASFIRDTNSKIFHRS